MSEVSVSPIVDEFPLIFNGETFSHFTHSFCISDFGRVEKTCEQDPTANSAVLFKFFEAKFHSKRGVIAASLESE